MMFIIMVDDFILFLVIISDRDIIIFFVGYLCSMRLLNLHNTTTKRRDEIIVLRAACFFFSRFNGFAQSVI